jgi:hypothetical protein
MKYIVRKDRPTFKLWQLAARHALSELEEYCRNDERIFSQLTIILGDRKKGIDYLLNSGISLLIVNQVVCDVVVRLSEEGNTAREQLSLIPELYHKGVACDNCGITPIVGMRFKCVECEDFDLCEKCFGKNGHFTLAHKRFLQIPSQRRAAASRNQS